MAKPKLSYCADCMKEIKTLKLVDSSEEEEQSVEELMRLISVKTDQVVKKFTAKKK